MPRLLPAVFTWTCACAALALVPGSGAGPHAAAPTPPAAPAHAALGTFIRGPAALVARTPATVRLAVHWASSESVSGPEAGAEVELRLEAPKGARRAVLFRGRTDGDGLVEPRFDTPAWPEGTYTLVAETRARGRVDHHETPVELRAGARLLLQSDKPLYQPTQTIHLRAVALRPQDGRPVGAHAIRFSVTDPRGNVVFREDATTSRFGVAAVDFKLADEISLGEYRAQAELPGDDGTTQTLALPVDRYKLPSFAVTVQPARAWVRPGESVGVTVEARYFFGKPVVGGTVTLKATTRGGRLSIVDGTQRARTDATGRVRLEVKALGADEATLAVEAEVEDTAEHRETGRATLPVSPGGLRVEVTPEAPALVPGVDNRVFVVVARPDGTPASGARIRFGLSNGATPPPDAVADALGVATVTLTPRADGQGGACGRGRERLLVRAELDDGASAHSFECLAIAPPGELLVRTDRALYPAGAPLELEVQGLGADGLVLVDVVKDGQHVDGGRLTLTGGRGHLTLRADERRFGTLDLVATRVDPDGAVHRGSRLVYVERPSALKIEARLDKSAAPAEDRPFRPGESGRLRVRVVDAQSGRGAEAQVLAVMVDKSLLALKAMKPGASRLYFHLADAARDAARKKLVPGGRTVEQLLDEERGDALAAEAAEILLAGARPAPTPAWATDPWAERQEARERQIERLAQAARTFVSRNPAGEEHDGKWRWRSDLVAAMVATGAVRAADLRDPWGRRLETTPVVQAAGLGEFDAWAKEEVGTRLEQIYRALDKAQRTGKLAADESTKGAVRVRAADLEALVAAGLPRGALLDPWGRPFRLSEQKRVLRIARLRSRDLVASLGPDGKPDTKDDLFPVAAYAWGNDRDDYRIWAVDKKEALAAGRGTGTGYGYGYGGLRGVGAGGGGAGFGSIGLGSIGTIGHGAGVAEARVRRDFPETMLWRPDVVTDAAGEAVVPVTMADSITSWHLGLEAVAADGRMGALAQEVRVFQDFFVDVDLPLAATQHDELWVPVSVYNYLPTRQRVTLTVDEAPWMALLGPKSEVAELAPGEVTVRHFHVGVRGVGQGTFTVRARADGGFGDAVERPLRIRPDGDERVVSFQDRLSGDARPRHALTIPPDAIADASIGTLKLYPSSATHVIEGLDSMLRMPGGCFEQTSSSTYPNALILDYLRKTGKSTPAVEKKAKEYLAAGYQRLLTFEVKGGGFSWFGDAPANKILTAYGLEEFFDMARVQTVDPQLIARTQRWLAEQQKPDGSWEPDTRFINEGATNRFNTDRTRITAYVALSLQRTGWRGREVERAIAYVRKNLDGVAHDPYTLSLAAELLGRSEPDRGALEAVLETLWRTHEEQAGGRSVAFSTKEKTPTYGDGKSGTVETTARAAAAMVAGRGNPARIDRAVAYLLGSKDSFGNWYSTQATILSLRALLAAAGPRQSGRATVRVRVDGREVAATTLELSSDLLTALDLPKVVEPGAHAVELSVEAPAGARLGYQLVGRWWEPRKEGPAGVANEAAAEAHGLTVASRLDRAELKVRDAASLHVTAHSDDALDMPMITVGLPPGFDVEPGALDALVGKHHVTKVQRDADGLVIYLSQLKGALALDVGLRPRLAVRAQATAPTLYEYYRPERRAVGAPLKVTVAMLK